MNLPINKLPIDELFFLIDFLGVFVGALGGALTAVRDTRYKYDLVGVAGLAMASALGGGVTRDLILQQGNPQCLHHDIAGHAQIGGVQLLSLIFSQGVLLLDGARDAARVIQHVADGWAYGVIGERRRLCQRWRRRSGDLTAVNAI